MRTLTKITTATALATGLLAAPAFAAGWDMNDDQTIDEDEIDLGLGRSFDGLDQNDDGMVSREEYNTAMMMVFDSDESGDLDQEEAGVLGGNRYVNGLEDINDEDVFP